MLTRAVLFDSRLQGADDERTLVLATRSAVCEDLNAFADGSTDSHIEAAAEVNQHLLEFVRSVS